MTVLDTVVSGLAGDVLTILGVLAAVAALAALGCALYLPWRRPRGRRRR